jgi:hypothetical protein
LALSQATGIEEDTQVHRLWIVESWNFKEVTLKVELARWAGTGQVKRKRRAG